VTIERALELVEIPLVAEDRCLARRCSLPRCPDPWWLCQERSDL